MQQHSLQYGSTLHILGSLVEQNFDFTFQTSLLLVLITKFNYIYYLAFFGLQFTIVPSS